MDIDTAINILLSRVESLENDLKAYTEYLDNNQILTTKINNVKTLCECGISVKDAMNIAQIDSSSIDMNSIKSVDEELLTLLKADIGE